MARRLTGGVALLILTCELLGQAGAGIGAGPTSLVVALMDGRAYYRDILEAQGLHIAP